MGIFHKMLKINIKCHSLLLILTLFDFGVKTCFALKFVNVSDCFPTSGTTPSCKITQEDADFECVRPGVLRVVGDYKVVYINCTANYPLDFKFDGQKPTDAIKVNSWGEVATSSGGNFKSFHLGVKIFSILSLYKYYNSLFPERNLSLPDSRNYSRTGNYIVSGYHEQEDLQSTFYIFFEEKVTQRFLRNEGVRLRLPQNDAERETHIVLPCRPPNFHDNVTLQQSVNTIGFTYDATSGFTSTGNWKSVLENAPQLLSLDQLTFTCKLGNGKNNDDLIEFSTNASKVDYGYEGLPKSIDVATYNVELLTNGSALTRQTCTFEQQQNNDEIGTIITQGVENPMMYRLLQLFVLPVFFNRSYSITYLSEPLRNGAVRIQEGTTYLVGNTFCGNQNSYQVATVGVGVSGRHANFKYGQDFPRGNRENYFWDNYFKISHDENKELYQNQEVTFRCYIHSFFHIPPAIWYTERANGTFVEEAIDYDWKKSFFSFVQIKLSSDIRKVICSSSLWHKVDWRNGSLEVKLLDSKEPTFASEEDAIVIFPLHSKNRILKCSAHGIPQPHIYWQWQGKNISSTATTADHSSILEFSAVTMADEGEYDCFASNVAQTSKKTFTVKVIEETASNYNGLIIGVPVVVLICGIIAIIAWICVRLRIEKRGLTKAEIQDFLDGDSGKDYSLDNNAAVNEYVHEYAHLRAYKKEYEIPPNRFSIDKANVLGSGAYGMVLKGWLDGEPVAIKTVKRNADKSYLKALLSELKIMIYMGVHENIVSILGASTSNLSKGQIYIFVPFCDLGSLEMYLRNRRSYFISELLVGSGKIIPNTSGSQFVDANRADVVNSNYTNVITTKDLYQWAVQVAQGMEYLSNIRVIHGDLAARNILLSQDRIVKITDFGLSRQLYNYAEYAKKNQTPLPWRYMALESLRDLTFSTQSDVWSYGITLWEIFSLAQTPYPGYAWTMAFVEELENGLRLPRPQHASNDLYTTVMRECWASNPQLRPSFGRIKEVLTALYPSDTAS